MMKPQILKSFLSEKVGVEGVWMDGKLEGKSSLLKGGFLPKLSYNR